MILDRNDPRTFSTRSGQERNSQRRERSPVSWHNLISPLARRIPPMSLLPLHGGARLHCSQRAGFPYYNSFCIQQASVLVISLRFAGLMYPLFSFSLKNLSVDARHYHLILFCFSSHSCCLLIPHLSFCSLFFFPANLVRNFHSDGQLVLRFSARSIALV